MTEGLCLSDREQDYWLAGAELAAVSRLGPCQQEQYLALVTALDQGSQYEAEVARRQLDDFLASPPFERAMKAISRDAAMGVTVLPVIIPADTGEALRAMRALQNRHGEEPG